MTIDNPDPGTARRSTDGAGSTTLEELERTARDAVAQLSQQADPEAFQALLRLSALVGECLGVSARTLATTGSWARVAEVAGTSRQAAWSRWSS
ncbi:MAG TPA: hypothetical protein VES02_06600 [Dermatophilaceae bacterium]|nr:hypothetical protein [Dermatophilaceae bacterium]